MPTKEAEYFRLIDVSIDYVDAHPGMNNKVGSDYDITVHLILEAIKHE